MTETVPKITIKELRARHNLSQEKFAESVGTTAQTVSAWEKNQLSISPKNMVRICKKYHIQSSDLYGIWYFFTVKLEFNSSLRLWKEQTMNELERTALNEILRTVTYIAEKLDELDSKISSNDSQVLEHQENWVSFPCSE